MTDQFMKLGRALEIVLELAEQNVIDDPDMMDVKAEQDLAIATVTDWTVNNLDEDD